MKVEIQNVGNDQIGVICPYTSKFVNAAHALNGKWDGNMWVFDDVLLDIIKTKLMDIYCTDGSPCERVSIKITAIKDLSSTQDSVTFFGLPIAKASGRDSGAKVCDGAAMISGKIGSGGSRQYWTTWVSEGSEFIVKDLPIAWLQKISERWSIEQYGASKVDATALTTEKDALLKRLAEIDRMLTADNWADSSASAI